MANYKTPTHPNCFDTHGLLLRNCVSEFEYNAALNALYGEVVAAHHPLDKGKYGDAGEFIVRVFLRRHAAVIPGQLWIAGKDKTDCQVSYKDATGKRCSVKVEVKTGSGEINDIPKSQFIAYCPEIDPSMDDILEQFSVFSTAEFMELISDASYTEFYRMRSKTGQCKGKSMVRVHENGRINIQSFRTMTQPSASLPIREYLEMACATHPNLRQWEAQLRG